MVTLTILVLYFPGQNIFNINQHNLSMTNLEEKE